MSQKFYASADTFTSPNGAVGHRPGGPFDCLGPYAKVKNCPIDGTEIRLTCYASGYADTAFSVPANTRYRGHHIGGFFTSDEQGTVFNAHRAYWQTLSMLAPWASSSGRIILDIRKDDALRCATPGKLADADVFDLSQREYMREQFARVIDADIRAELAELGAWSDAELADKFQNRIRLLWVACCDIREALLAKVQS
jgi:hypothetical protein